MNILTSSLPTKIRVNDNIYDINYDYKTVINILLAFEDEELTIEEKNYIMINNLYKDEIRQEDYITACEKAIKFIDCGNDEEDEHKSNYRIYSFEKDASYIFTGISMTHHIDLEIKSDLHWWKFVSLFMDMSPDCMFGQLVYYRKRKAEGKLTKEEKKQYEKIKDIVDLERTHKISEARRNFFKKYNENRK